MVFVGNFWMFENCMLYVFDGDYILCSVVEIFVKDFGIIQDMVCSVCFFVLVFVVVLQMFLMILVVGMGCDDDVLVVCMYVQVMGVKLFGDK